MPDPGLAHQLTEVRAEAARLVAQCGGEAAMTAPFLHALAALEARIHDTLHALDETTARVTQLEQVLTDVPTGVCILDGPEHRYTLTNPVYEQFVGRSAMVGHTVRALFPEIADQGIYELLDQVYTTGEPFIARERLIEIDRQGFGVREAVFFDLIYRPLRAQDGRVTAVVAYVQDSTDRRALEQERERVLQLMHQAKQTAEAERQRLLHILRQAPAAICTLEGPEHVFTFTNPRYEHLIGRTDLIGQPVRAVLPEVEGQGFFELLDGVRETGIPFVGNEVGIMLDRHGTGALEQAWINFIYAPLRDGDVTITGLFVQAVEVTEVVTARQEAEAAVVLRDQFLSVAAHELKTPLTSLLGYTQILQRRLRREGEIEARTDHALSMIGAQAQRLNRLIDTLLDVARINMGQLMLERAPLDLGALTVRVVDEIGVTVEHRTITVTLPPAPCVVEGDSLRLEQVIVNLVQNAVKYSPEGGPIEVEVGCDGEHASIQVRDEGMGIPAAALPHLFDRFYRVADGAARFISGMGIGLSVVQDIMTLHGGTIRVESTEGVGSTFTVCLPLGNAIIGAEE